MKIYTIFPLYQINILLLESLIKISLIVKKNTNFWLLYFSVSILCAKSQAAITTSLGTLSNNTYDVGVILPMVGWCSYIAHLRTIANLRQI